LFGCFLMVSGQVRRWPKKGTKVIIPYVTDKAARYTTRQLNLIRKSMDEIEKQTCIRFHKHTNEKDYIRIYSGKGCVSFIGKIGGRQNLSLNKKGCVWRLRIVHELIHAIGFNHMHERYDRDKYLTIKWNNIEKDKKPWFKKLNNKNEAFNTKYDLLSAMHYSKNEFSKNRKDTIVTKNRSYRNKIGKVATLSKGDVQRINRMYNCPKKK